jgi:hypothetical protein
MNIRQSDELRSYIRTNALPTFNPAVSWQEDEAPFTMLDEPIIYCRQDGRPVDAFVRQVAVDVYVFSKANALNSDMDALFDNAVTALEYVKANPKLNDDIMLTVTTDVTGEFYTGQNRRYYRFQVLCYTS